MDGLMIDSENVTFRIVKDILEQKGYTFTRDMYINLLGRTRQGARDIYKGWYGEDYDYQGVSEELAKRLIHTLSQELPIKPGLYELLNYLRENGYKTCIATSSLRSKVDAILPKTLIEYFDYVLCGDEVNIGKPNPEVFLKCCERLNVLPEEAIVLEDSEVGIEASVNGNIKVICIPDMKEPSDWHKKQLAGYYTSLEEVIDYLERERA